MMFGSLKTNMAMVHLTCQASVIQVSMLRHVVRHEDETCSEVLVLPRLCDLQ